MQIAIVAAGFSPGEADALRRAMGAWKRSGGIEHFKDKLLQGMARNNYTAEFVRAHLPTDVGFWRVRLSRKVTAPASHCWCMTRRG